eukprot:1467618-Lingulodinium_polyedra.AAC.1
MRSPAAFAPTSACSSPSQRPASMESSGTPPRSLAWALTLKTSGAGRPPRARRPSLATPA